jgi:hypothetical protein
VVSSFISGERRGFYYMSLHNGQTLFYISDDELFSSTGDKGQLVRGIDGRVTGLYAYALTIFIEVTDLGETITYFSEDGRTFIRLD